jgi:hypothetical protein
MGFVVSGDHRRRRPPTGSGTSPTILKICRMGGEADSSLLLPGRRPWPRCNTPARTCGWRSTTRSFPAPPAVAAARAAPLARGYTGSTSTMYSRPTAASISDSWLARAATSRSATTTEQVRRARSGQHRELVAQHEDLQVPGGGVAGDRAGSWMSGAVGSANLDSTGGLRRGAASRHRTACRCGPAAHSHVRVSATYRFLRGRLPT